VLHTGGFTKGGTGLLVLSGSNIYTGTTTVSSGVLRVANSAALGSTQSPTFVAGAASLEISGNTRSAEPVSVGSTARAWVI